MSLTTAQLAIFKTDIQAQGTLAAAVAAHNWTPVMDFYNAASATNVWLPAVRVEVLADAIDWTTTAVAGGNGGFQQLPAAARDAYFALTQGGVVDATQANIRNGFGSIFPANVASALAAVSQRVGTRLEVLLSTPAGSAVVTQVLGVGVTAQDVATALGV